MDVDVLCNGYLVGIGIGGNDIDVGMDKGKDEGPLALPAVGHDDLASTTPIVDFVGLCENGFQVAQGFTLHADLFVEILIADVGYDGGRLLVLTSEFGIMLDEVAVDILGQLSSFCCSKLIGCHALADFHVHLSTTERQFVLRQNMT